jgi:DDE superfamily endonuclease
MERMEDDDEAGLRRRRFLIILMLKIRERTTMRKTLEFRSLLNEEGRRRRNRHLRKEALADPKEAPWQKVWLSKDDSALITVTGIDFNAFNELLRLYKPHFEKYSPWTGDRDGRTYKEIDIYKSKGRGRKRLINASASLGLVLAWFRFRGAEWVLQGWFGFTGTHTNVWLRFGCRMLLKALLPHPEARVEFPSDERIAILQDIIRQRHEALSDVYCTMDGLKLFFQSCDELEEQGMYYNGWQHDHFVTNLLMFSACGRIISCVMNVPGSIHDSALALWGGVYDTLQEAYARTGGKCCVDSAFASANAPYLIRSSEDSTTKARTPHEMIQLREATSLRQALEWGMRAIQSSMPRLYDRIQYEAEPEETGYETERSIVLKLVPLIYNFRLEFVGLNQLRNTYVPNWSKDCDYYINQSN